MLIEGMLRYFGDTEVFRTSTEEPNRRGISYTYMKDMSQFMALWKQPQKVIFDLPNSLTDIVSLVPLTLSPRFAGARIEWKADAVLS